MITYSLQVLSKFVVIVPSLFSIYYHFAVPKRKNPIILQTFVQLYYRKSWYEKNIKDSDNSNQSSNEILQRYGQQITVNLHDEFTNSNRSEGTRDFAIRSISLVKIILHSDDNPCSQANQHYFHMFIFNKSVTTIRF